MYNFEKYCKIPFRLHCYTLCLQIRLLKITVSILSFISMHDCSGELQRAVPAVGKGRG